MERMAGDEEHGWLVEGWPVLDGNLGGCLVKEAQRWHELMDGGHGGRQGVGWQCDGGRQCHRAPSNGGTA